MQEAVPSPLNQVEYMLSFDRPGAHQPMMDGPVVEVTATAAVTQTFTCTEEMLYRVEVPLHASGRTDSGRLWFSLWEGEQNGNGASGSAGPLRRIGPLETADLSPCNWFSFEFEPLARSRGRVYTFRLEADPLTSGIAVRVLTGRQQGGRMHAGPLRREGSLAFRAVCLRSPAAHENFKLYRQALERGQGLIASRPLMVRPAVSDACTLNCIMCNCDGSRLTSNRGTSPFMPLQVFRSLEPVLPSLAGLIPFGLGEPFLNPDLLPILELAREKNPWMWIFQSTNGQQLKEDEIRRFTAGEMISELQVSVDAAQPDTFTSIRRGGDFCTVIHYLETLIRIREEEGTRFPLIKPAMVVMKRNAGEVTDFVRLMSDLGADSITLDSVKWEYSHELGVSDLAGVLRLEEQVAEAQAYLRDRPTVLGGPLLQEIPLFLNRRGHARQVGDQPFVTKANRSDAACRPSGPCNGMAAYPPCRNPWESLMLTTDGRALLCAVTHEPMGSVMEQGIEALWNGPRYLEERERMLSGRFRPKCEECMALSVIIPDSVVPDIYLARCLQSYGSDDTCGGPCSPDTLVGRRVGDLPMNQGETVTLEVNRAVDTKGYPAVKQSGPPQVTAWISSGSGEPRNLDLALATGGRIRTLERGYTLDGGNVQWSPAGPGWGEEIRSPGDIYLVQWKGNEPQLIGTSVLPARSFTCLVAGGTSGESIACADGLSVPVVPGDGTGYVDRAVLEHNALILSGWAADPISQCPPQAVALFGNGLFLGSVRPWVERSDVKQRCAEAAPLHAGFILKLPLDLLREEGGAAIRILVLSDLGTASELDYQLVKRWSVLGGAKSSAGLENGRETWILFQRDGLFQVQCFTNESVTLKKRWIVQGKGRDIPVKSGVLAGYLDAMTRAGGLLTLSGWAADLVPGRPARRVLAFAGSRLVSVSRPSLPRPDVVQDIGRTGLLYSGFRLGFPEHFLQAQPDSALRFFAVSHLGQASEILPTAELRRATRGEPDSVAR